MSKARKRRDLRNNELEQRKKRQKMGSDYNLHHLNPVCLIPRLLAELKPHRKKVLKKTGWTEEEFLDKISATKIVKTSLHDAWNLLFDKMFAWDAVRQIRKWNDNGRANFNDKEHQAWEALFGGEATQEDAEEIIKLHWWPEYPTIEDARRYVKGAVNV